jgi:hypothetical protein
MSDLDWLNQKADAMERAFAESLRQAREEAHAAGKEPFDFKALCRLYDPSSELSSSGKLWDPVATAASLESSYYLIYRGVRTIAEFAEALERDRT